MEKLRKHWVNFDEQDDFCRLYRGHFCQIFHETSITKSIRPTQPTMLEKKKVSLVKRESHKGTNLYGLDNSHLYLDKKTLILDLDETLIHCMSFSDAPAQVTLPITLFDGNTVNVNRKLVRILSYCVNRLE